LAQSIRNTKILKITEGDKMAANAVAGFVKDPTEITLP
jgi:hypothetical protein